jgi:hypothetical protein
VNSSFFACREIVSYREMNVKEFALKMKLWTKAKTLLIFKKNIFLIRLNCSYLKVFFILDFIMILMETRQFFLQKLLRLS